MTEEILLERRRSTATQAVDLTRLEPYYAKQNIFVSWTDYADFEMDSMDDREDRPYGVVAYPINDVVGRRVSTGTYYGRVFRYNMSGRDVLDVQQYTNRKLAMDMQTLMFYLDDKGEAELSDKVDDLHTEASRRSMGAFETLWHVTEQLSKDIGGASGDGYKDAWADLFTLVLGYEAIHDEKATGVIVNQRTEVLFIFNLVGIRDYEIVPVQKYKEDRNTYVRWLVSRHNKMTGNANRRRRLIGIQEET